MRVNMDSSILSDQRFRQIAESLSIDLSTVIGDCFRIWVQCYDRRSTCLSRRFIESIRSGFTNELLAEELAHDTGETDKRGSQLIEIHGVDRRIEFLREQSEKGSKGGKASGKSRRAKRQANAQADAQADAEPSASVGASGPAQATPEAYSLTPTPTLDQDLTSGDSSSTRPAPKAKKKKIEPRPQALEAAQHLASKIQERDPGGDYDYTKWVDEIDKLNRLDGRSFTQIKQVIDWCQADDFWQNNILSGRKLRVKFKFLWLKMNGEAKKPADRQPREMFKIDVYE